MSVAFDPPSAVPASNTRSATGASLRTRFFVLFTLILLLVGALTWLAYRSAVDRLIGGLGIEYAQRQAAYERERIRAPMLREIALAQQLADSPAVLAWASDESDPAKRAAGLAELDSARRAFRDGSFFLINDGSLDYYFNDRDGHFTGQERRYRLDARNAADAWYFRMRESSAPFQINVNHDEALRVTKVWINVPLRQGGQWRGLVGTGVDLTEFINRFVDSGDASVGNLIINASGAVQAARDQSRIAFGSAAGAASRASDTIFAAMRDDASRSRLREALRRATAQPDEVRTLTVATQDGPRLLGIAYLPEMQWFVISAVRVEAIAGNARFVPILAIFAAALLLGLSLVAWLLETRVLRRVARLAGATRAFASGQEHEALRDINDDAGRTDDELGRLAGDFAAMARTVGDTLANLESRVAQRTAALADANQALAAERDAMRASLRYARALQHGVLPSPAALRRTLGDWMLHWQPLDEVGGDFFFVVESAGCRYVGIADCTGHGVPGALTSLVAYEVVRRELRAAGRDVPLADTVARIDSALRDVLNPADAPDDAPDHGVAIAVCRLGTVAPVADGDAGQAEFCGYGIDCHVLRPDGGLDIVDGARGGLGYRRRRPTPPAVHAFDVATDDRLYLCSDGILDQPGGERGFGFGRTRFAAWLQSQAHRPFAVQPDALTEALAAYAAQRGARQRDDQVVLGFFALPRGVAHAAASEGPSPMDRP
ncbi:SpoIIE family protein phosphatase [Chitinasiproducens palmae]|uniref:SpoIIE family protein phosphatase n=1 Tax=Chitinasiproducens palmae TaxID=1770053 RepID=UPI00147E3ABD|nr:SpoIIE family protein phosphatase [Chitinasiproducens palmae]